MLAGLAAGFVSGVSSQVFWTTLPSVACAAAGTLAILLLAPWIPARCRLVAAIALGAGCGLLWAGWVSARVLDARLPVDREGMDFQLTGEVLSLRQHGDGTTGWTLSVAHVPWGDGCRLPGGCRIRLGSWQPMPLQPGERWQLLVRLKRPRAMQNPGVADFERFLFGERVVATGTVRESVDNRRVAPPSAVAAWRAQLLGAALPLFGAGAGDLAQDEAGLFARAVLPALVLDERSLLAAGQWRVLADTGTAHLVAISGLHVALLWGAILWLFALLQRRRVANLRHDRLAVPVALAAAVVYALVAGMPLPAQRAVVMLAIASLFLLFAGSVPGWRIWLAAAAGVLLVDPLAVHAAGFWLSFIAVGMLLALHDLHRRARVPLAGWARVPAGVVGAVRLQAMISLLLAPLLLALFGAASVSSVLANLPAIPWVNLLALPPGLIGFVLAPFWPAGADVFIDISLAALTGLWHWLVWVDAIGSLRPLTAHGATVPGLLALAVAVPLLLLARVPWMRLAAVVLVVLAWPVPPPVPRGALDMCVLDVGQGLAVAMRSARHAVLYDSGPGDGERDAGGSIVVPALRAMGARALDLFVVSHADQDHAGGAVSVVGALRPATVVAGEAGAWEAGAWEAGAGERVQAERCDRERRWSFDAVGFRLLPQPVPAHGNDSSCVLLVEAGNRRVLLPGDITRRREDELVATWGSGLRADVLVAANHGSKSSTGSAFLRQARPGLVVYSVGYRNRFRHPHPDVARRVGATGARSASTADRGAVCLRLGPRGEMTVTGTREATRPYWRR